MATVRGATLLGPDKLEIREYPIPDIPADGPERVPPAPARAAFEPPASTRPPLPADTPGAPLMAASAPAAARGAPDDPPLAESAPGPLEHATEASQSESKPLDRRDREYGIGRSKGATRTDLADFDRDRNTAGRGPDRAGPLNRRRRQLRSGSVRTRD